MFSSWANALQSTLAQAQEAVTSAQEVAYEASRDFFAMEGTQSDQQQTHREGSGATVQEGHALLKCPSSLASQQWAIVMEVAFKDSNFFVIPPARVMVQSDAKTSLERVGLLGTCEGIPLTDPQNLTPELLAPLVANASISDMHYSVMPRLVSDTQFWQHCLWRLAVLGCCTSIYQLLDVYEAITSENELGEPRMKLHGVDNKVLCNEMRANALAAQQDVDWLLERQRSVDDALKNAGGSCQLLGTFIAKKEQTELSDSVFESCKYHKTKLASLIGDLEANAPRLADSDLDPQSQGERYTELIQQNEALMAALNGYTSMLVALKESASSSGVALEPTASAVSPSLLPSTKVAPQGTSPNHAQVDAASDDDFSAKLPWDDEDED